ncbi:sensor histidine kinase [Halpernia frigidisoli]|uniref:histidine kinase n=1 Tax=Halpernia frigidisoli TaxID=1125876 RepID=A0A1I3F589_9FLAO|nr:HAMP domain-containing sensor histidine kinase [Halpernia frigidisoli]SFI06300.1 Histidine kinase-, DNA gyrase B-, and HSP90-like ATPase [Halpernia frigidisoli]
MKRRSFFSRFNNWFVFIVFSAMIIAIILSTTILINYLRKEEIKRINLFATAIKYQQEIKSPSPEILDLVLQIGQSNNSMPFVVTDKNNVPTFQANIPPEVEKSPEKMSRLMRRMKNKYPPIEIEFPDHNNQFVYYDNSDLLNNLRYYPFVLGLFIFAYLLFSFWFLRTIKKTDEGFLWAGLAKETAHQIGTPLSSMIGWIEVLREENPNSEGVKEFEKDIYRLKTISERFSKIGSVPTLNDLNINETVQQNFDYLKNRISSKVNFSLKMPNQEILIPHSKILMSWVVENLVKNAVDAMRGVGNLAIVLTEKNDLVTIDIKDSGSGMTTSQIRNAFNPGFSTKKRGWGLGLSLAKRVIKEYHNGDIKIVQSEIGQGTTFRISMKNS